MGKDTSGAEAVNPFDAPEFNENTEDEKDLDGLSDEANDGDDALDDEESSEEESTEDKESEEDESEEGDDEESDDEDEESEEEDEDDRPTIKKILDEEEAEPLPARKSKHQPLGDGDYEEEDGKVIIRAQHLVDEIVAVENNLKTYLKIYDKGDKAKAEFLAEKVFGFEGDDIRSAGKVMYDVMDAYVNAKGREAKAAIVDKYFTDQLKDEDFETNVYSEIEEKSDENSDKSTKPDKHTEKDFEKAIKLWQVDTDKKVDVAKLLDDPDFADAFSANSFDPKTGEALAFQDKVNFALNSMDHSKSSEGSKEKVSIGGDKKGKKVAKKAAKAEPKVFDNTGFIDPTKAWQ